MANEQSPQHAPDTASQPSWATPVKPVVPDHELLVRIGGGSYGDVWLARSVVGTWRAVKVVFRDRFLDTRPYEREFSGIQKFEPLSRSNEGFIDILQIGRNDAEGYFYYVMELADDASDAPEIRPETYVPKTLAKALLKRGRLPVTDCLELGLTLNLGLTRLHEAGLIHRDIKPSNIIFVAGVPKLADIGLVIEVAEARSYVGTEGFIPPEGPNSPQADLYSLGKVLYEAGMGKDRKDFPEPLTQIARAPDSTELLELNAILLKACAANILERYKSAGEMNADLALLQSGGSVRRQRTLARRLRSVQRAGALLIIVALVVGAGWLWQAHQTQAFRELALEKSVLAGEKSKLAEENRERLVRLHIANGVRLMDDNDPSGALLWFADALPLVTNNATTAEIHRIRIQQTLDQAPRLLNAIGESNSIIASAFSSDGLRIASATWDRDNTSKLAVWDAQTGQQLWELQQCQPINQLHFAQDGRRLYACSTAEQGTRGAFASSLPPERQQAEVLDAQTGRKVFPELSSNLVCSAFSPDDRWLAVALTNHDIQLLDTSNGKLVAELRAHTNAITGLAFNDEGNLLASGSRDGTARIWRVPSGEPIGAPFRHDEVVRCVALSVDGLHLATSTWESDEPKDSQIYLWDVQDGKRIGEPITEPGALRALFFSPGGDTLFTGGEPPTPATSFVRLWNVVSGLSFQRNLAFPGVRCRAFSADRRMLGLGTDSGFVSIWSTETWEPVFLPFHHNGWVESVHFSPDGKKLLTSSDDGTAKIWSLMRDAETARLTLPANLYPRPAEYQSLRGRTPGPIAVILMDGLHLVDPDRLVNLRTLKAQETNASLYGWTAGSTGGYWVCLPPRDAAFDYRSPQEITLWKRQETGFESLRLLHPQSVAVAQFNADDSRLVTFAWDRIVRFWRTSDGTLERSILVPNSWPVRDDILIEPFDRDCRTFLHLQMHDQTDNDAHFHLFDLVTGQFSRAGINDFPKRIRFSPDGKLLAYVSGQMGTIINLQTGEPVAPPFKHGGDLLDLDWSPDGRKLITAGLSGEVKLWDAATGEMLLSPMPQDKGIGSARSARWSADGRFIVTRSDEINRARVWDASTAEAITPFLLHSGYIRWVCITPGNRLITASDPNLLRAWDLKPTSLEPNILADYARLLSGRKSNAGGVLLPIPARDLAGLAKSLRARAPQLFQ